jgi:beta-glucanase (GH16 family)
MKNKILLSAFVLVAILSCQKDEVIDTSVPQYSAIDPDTPTDARPFIVDEAKSNSRTPGVPTTLISAASYKLVYSDEFDNGTILDETKWTKEDSGYNSKGLEGRDSALKWWGTSPNYVTVNNGYLKLSSHKSEVDRLFCGSVTSNNADNIGNDGIETKYGYFEALIDIQTPGVTGTQTAFWLMGDAMKDQPKGQSAGPIVGSGADGAEIDIFESSWLNDKTGTAIHCDGYVDGIKFGTGMHWTADNIENGFHYFGLLWRSDRLEIYYDGQLEVSMKAGEETKAVRFTESKYIPLVKEYIKLSAGAAFGNANTGFSTRAIGSIHTSLVDWVRV